MAKAIRRYPKSVREGVIRRRLANPTKGLGYWAAVDAQNRINAGQKEMVLDSTSKAKVEQHESNP